MYILLCIISLSLSFSLFSFFDCHRWLRRNYHYLSLNQSDLCNSLEQALEWGRSHPNVAEQVRKVHGCFQR